MWLSTPSLPGACNVVSKVNVVLFALLIQAGRCRKCGMAQGHENHALRERVGEAVLPVLAQDAGSTTPRFKDAAGVSLLSKRLAESASSGSLGGGSAHTLTMERTPTKVGIHPSIACRAHATRTTSEAPSNHRQKDTASQDAQ